MSIRRFGTTLNGKRYGFAIDLEKHPFEADISHFDGEPADEDVPALQKWGLECFQIVVNELRKPGVFGTTVSLDNGKTETRLYRIAPDQEPEIFALFVERTSNPEDSNQ